MLRIIFWTKSISDILKLKRNKFQNHSYFFLFKKMSIFYFISFLTKSKYVISLKKPKQKTPTKAEQKSQIQNHTGISK